MLFGEQLLLKRRVDPAKNLDLLIRELLHPVRQPAGRTPEEVSDGKQ